MSAIFTYYIKPGSEKKCNSKCYLDEKIGHRTVHYYWSFSLDLHEYIYSSFQK